MEFPSPVCVCVRLSRRMQVEHHIHSYNSVAVVTNLSKYWKLGALGCAVAEIVCAKSDMHAIACKCIRNVHNIILSNISGIIFIRNRYLFRINIGCLLFYYRLKRLINFVWVGKRSTARNTGTPGIAKPLYCLWPLRLCW